MSIREVTIVGAGIGGAVAALALQRRNIDVRLYEQAPELGEIGAGIFLSPNAINVLYALGLRDALERIQFDRKVFAMRNYKTGEVNFETPLDAKFVEKYGASCLDFHRADLHNALICAVQKNNPDSVVLNAQVTGVRETEQGVELSFKGGTSKHTPIAIAADGVHSIMRGALHGDLDAEYTGHVAYRGLVPADSLNLDAGDQPIGIWVGPGRHFVAYFVRRGELLNYVALVEEPGWKTESWTTKADKAQLSAYFEEWDPAVQGLIAQTPAEQCFKWALLVRQPLSRWSTPRTTLLGDAAHPMVPYLGQGAAMAIEDGWVFAHFCATNDDPADALRAYEHARLERTSAVQAAAWEQGQLNHAVGTGKQTDEFKGGNFAKVDWIYGHNVTALYS